MRSYQLILFCLILSGELLFAQEQIPVEKKAGIGKNDRLFTNKALGLYLWLSTSPDENSEKFRLMSDSSKKHTNPMYFDTEGYNTFRSPSCVDTNSKRVIFPLQDIVFEVYSDSRAPETKILISGEKVKTKKNKQVYKGKADVGFNAYDATSGIESIYYSINGQSYTKYTEKFSIQTTGENLIKFYSTDIVGNREEPKKHQIIIE
jgi:hypothetical protein